jgi:hypothetical protein
MSGFEVAGLILAIIPLYDQAVKTAETATKAIEANQERRKFAKHLLVVDAILRSTALKLFESLDAELTLDQWNALIRRDVEGSKLLGIWREISKACPTARDDSVWVAIEVTLGEIAKALVKVVKYTKMSKNVGTGSRRMDRKVSGDPAEGSTTQHRTNPNPTDGLAASERDGSRGVKKSSASAEIQSEASEDSAKILQDVIRRRETDPDPFSKAGIFGRFMFAISSRSRTKQLENLSALSQTLRTLTAVVSDEKSNPTVRGKTDHANQKQYARDLNTVRNHCHKLYGSLFKNWRCKCHVSPRALLRLESRSSNIDLLDLRFSIILDFEDSRGNLGRGYKMTGISVHDSYATL